MEKIKKTLFFCLLLFVFQLSYCQEKKDSIIKDIEITPELIFKKNVFSKYKISPDGKYFVTILESNVGYQVVVIEINTHMVYKKFPVGPYPVRDIKFVTKNRLLLEIRGKIIAIDVDGTNSSVIVDVLSDKKKYYYNTFRKHLRLNNIVNVLPEDKERILIESFNYKGYSTIKKVNIFTGNEEILANGDQLKIHKWFVDLKGNVKIGFREKKSIYTYYKKSKESNKLEELKIKLNGFTYSVKTDGASYLNQPITFEGFAEQENVIYLGTNINSDKRKLISYNLIEDKYLETVLEDPIYDITDPMLDNSELVYDNFKLLGVYFDGAYLSKRWINMQMQELQIKIDKKYPSYINQIIGFDKNKKNLVVKKWNDTYRGVIGIYNVENNTFSTMVSLNKELKEFRFSSTKNVILKTKDGGKIQGYYNTPKNIKENQKIPLIVIPHGGPWSRDTWGFDPIVRYFNQKGYATLKLNYRGSVGFGKNHLIKGIKNINTIMISDIAEGVNYIKENKHEIDSRNIFIYGHSYGGYAAYMSIIKYPNLYNAAVSVSGISDLKKQMKEYKKNKEFFAYEFWEAALGTNKSEKLKSISPYYHIDKINTPVFIFHGEKDEIINVEQAKKMNMKLKESGKNSSLRVIKKEGHSLYNSNNIIYILDTTTDFFNQFIKK